MKNAIAEVVEILMECEGITEQEAMEKIKECREMAAECGYDYNQVEEIMSSELGLEMDYVFALL